MVKRIAGICAAAAVMVLMVMMLASTEAYAAKDLELDKTSLDMDTFDTYKVFIEKKSYCTENISDVEVSKPGVVYVDKQSIDDGRIRVQALGTGHVDLTVKGTEGSSIPVSVDVGEKGLQTAMDDLTMTQAILYGETKAVIEVLPGSNYTLSIGDDTFSGAAAENDDWVSEIKIDLKGVMYDIGTKVTLTATKQGITATESSKVVSSTWVESIKASKKTFSIESFNLHKGDVVKIKYSGKTYSKKITKNYDNDDKTVKIKVKKKIAKNAKITFWIVNQYKSKLYKKTAKLHKYKWSEDD